MPTVKQTSQRLNGWMEQHPRQNWTAEEPLREAVEQAVQSVVRRRAGQSYTAGTDPGVRALEAEAVRTAGEAARSTAQTAAALGSGYGTDYARSAADQSAQSWLDQAANSRPALRTLARSAEEAQNGADRAGLAALWASQSLADTRQRDQTQDWQALRDYLTAGYQQAEQERSDTWKNVVQAVDWLLSTGADVYDTYKGYKQQQWQNDYQTQLLDWQKQQYADSQNWRQQEWDQSQRAYADSRSDKEREWTQTLRAYEDSRDDAQYDRSVQERRLSADLAKLALQRQQSPGGQGFYVMDGVDRAAGYKASGISAAQARARLGQYGYTQEEIDSLLRVVGY